MESTHVQKRLTEGFYYTKQKQGKSDIMTNFPQSVKISKVLLMCVFVVECRRLLGSVQALCKNSPGDKQGNTLRVNAQKCQKGLNKTSQ